jgi:hypothetical protein
VLWGVQPETIAVSLALSPSVAAQVETLVDKVLAELNRWGIEPTRRPPRAAEGSGTMAAPPCVQQEGSP